MKKIILCCLMLLSAFAGHAQVANNTSLVGTVTDPSGAVVAGAKVIGINRETKVEYPATTNAEGYYSIPFINPGTYDVVVDKDGFRKVTTSGVVVTLNLSVRTDVAVTVGSATDTVTVSAETPALSTDDAVIGETLSAKTVENLPMNTRRVMELAATASNIIVGPKTSYTGVPPGANFIGAGTREVTNSLTLDGITIMNSLISSSPVTPNPDAVAAVQTQNGNYTAQYGAYMGVHINVDTKSGTNKLHGTVYDYVQNDFFNAKPFTALSTSRTPVLRFNQFGAEVGGPIVIPHVFNGRDKAFFMGSYEGTRRISQANSTGQLITDSMRTGDFSALCTSFVGGTCAAGAGIQLKNPATGVNYANNQVTNISPIATALLAYYPHPNLAGVGTNFNENIASVFNKNATLDRVDYNLGEKVRLFARYTYEKSNAVNGAIVATSQSFSPTTDSNAVIGYTHIIKPNLINDLRFGYNKFTSNQLNYFAQNGLLDAGTKLGIPGFVADTANGNPGIPTIAISGGYQGLGAEGTNWFQDDRTLHGYDQISYTRGRHNFMAGADIRRMTIGRAATNQNRGQFSFTGNYSGNAAADFLTGYSQTVITPLFQIKASIAEWRDGFFVQDNWQVSQKLTVLYGVRYELPTVPYSLNGIGRILNSDYTALIPTSSATTGAAYTPVKGFKFNGPNHDLVSPRLGLAYRATDKIVVRSGGGIYYNPNHLNAYTLSSSNYPFAASTTYSGPTSGIATQSFSNPSGGGSGSASAVAGTPGSYQTAFTDNYYLPTPRLYQWNLDTGVDLGRGNALEFQYLGSHSIHLDHSLYPNQPLPGAGSVNPRRPYQLFGQIRQIQNDGLGTYHGLTVVYRQRTWHGLDMNLGYTWAHTLDTSNDANGGGTPMIQYNLKADYGNANWDIRNRFVGAATYAMPTLARFGHLTDTLAGGWHANTIVTIQGGQPFNVGITNDQANVGGIGTQRPNYVHAPVFTCGKAQYIAKTSCIDTTAYSLPAQYTFGNSHRNDQRGPGAANVSLSVFKDFPVFESVKIQLRGEAFNVFNHANLANPGNVTLPTATNGVFNFTGSTFGEVTGTQSGLGDPRILQLAGKINF
ncbi:TonB-dependent receptor [Granulicella sibirica]|uniref:Oar protein n=1 Tax=Granulicella sibirica TaxID=2479048 RepID=A0A4Q0SZQ8_9BACT|nr:TonB-dependent receptor [Granulicella sibirica]RXH55530.1 Oar protein [Granulicella sibirica]